MCRCMLFGTRARRLAVWLLSAGFCLTASADDSKEKIDSTENPFRLTSVWKIQLTLSAAEYEAMQPVVPGVPESGEQPSRRGDRDSERNYFGTQFPWVTGSVTIDGRELREVGIRYDGGITYFMSAFGLKRPIEVRLTGEDFAGAKSLRLHAMPLDPAKAREVLAFSIFKDIGVPVPRTAFAEVTLDVPGRYDEEFLGLYTVVEGIDDPFLTRHFRSAEGLLMEPFGVRGIGHFGSNWERYEDRYHPRHAATGDQSQRVIEFARLVNEATDEEFRAQIDSFIDRSAFLRFWAANALTSNLESFFALGHNYHLYLDPHTNRFHFLPDELEFSFANFLLMGSADELMDLRLTHPYPGENQLPDRLLAIDEVRQQYLDLLRNLLSREFTEQKLLARIAAIDGATRPVREREARAVMERGGPPPGLAGPPGGPQPPQPPELKAFVARRVISAADQLAGRSEGFVPRPPVFGGAPRQQDVEPIDQETFQEQVKAPAGFDITLYAHPPQVNYPVAIAAGLSDEIYLASDEQGSLGRTSGGGKVLRCVDSDGDGHVDEVTVFARVEHPRGVCYRDGSLWVMHPPVLSVFRDDGGDGVAEHQAELVTGLTTSQIDERGGDHTTNCVRMGIDGWLYIGVGDYGIQHASGTDGTTISLRGGGIVRVRPDGTELEIYCTGLRNPFDVGIDPFLNLYTRDNTNDGAGWDTRVMHLVQTGSYGYTQLYANFTEETMPPLGTFGGGGGTSGLFLQNPDWPTEWSSVLLTGDWGRSEVYRHRLTPNGPTFGMQTDVFLRVPRATGMDMDAQGRLYVASWYGGEASRFVGPDVGFVARVAPRNLEPPTLPALVDASLGELINQLSVPYSVRRMHAQGELLRRGPAEQTSEALLTLATDSAASTEGRVAAIFTLKQLDGAASHPALLRLTSDDQIREFALRALTDRASQLDGLTSRPFVEALNDASARVRAQSLISLSRLGDRSAAATILPLTDRPHEAPLPSGTPLQNQPDPERVLPHLAVRTLISLGAVEECLAALEGPHWQGALGALRCMHDTATVDGLIQRLRTARDAEVRLGILVALMRLCHRQADYDGSWWGIRPDNTGPYYDPIEWEMSERIRDVLTAALLDSDTLTAAQLKSQLKRHQLMLPGISEFKDSSAPDRQQPIAIPEADPDNPDQIGNLSYEIALRRTLAAEGDPAAGEQYFRSQSCIACHTIADGQTPQGPHLADIGRRSTPAELLESILRPSGKLAQGYETHVFVMQDGQVFSGFIVGTRAETVLIRENNGVGRELKRAQIDTQASQTVSAMPESLAANLTPEQFADLLAYLKSLK
jgi:putative membrane-bound dehydrogenase-like protein